MRIAREGNPMLRLRLKRCFPAAILFFILFAIGFPLGAQKQRAQEPIKIDATKLQGVVNFRDIGGYKTADGRTIRYNLLYRSAQLHDMTLSDNQKLAPLKIRYEIDVRSPAERSNAPTQWGPDPPEVIDIPFLIPRTATPPNFRDPAQMKAQRVRFYTASAVDNASKIGQVLHDLAQGDEPALIHCTGGADRTGITVAVLMKLLGASHKDIYREYLLTGKLSEEQTRRLAAYSPVPLSPEVLKTLTINASLLDSFFQSIQMHYGSFDAYIRDGLKLSSQDVQSLRRIFLTN